MSMTAAPSIESIVVNVETCDRCGAPAAFMATRGFSELNFCGHHGRALRERLEADGFEVAALALPAR